MSELSPTYKRRARHRSNWKEEKEIEVVEELIMSYQQSIANGRVQSFCSESVERRFISDGTAPSG
jgi:hypothetical protein